MAELDYAWVREELERLHSRWSQHKWWALFQPTSTVYGKLESGEDSDLQAVTNLIGQHLRLAQIPPAQYEWGLRMPLHVAGEIRSPGTVVSLIRIPFFYVGKPYAIGAILAHEMSHQLLALEGIWYPDEDKNERLTDLASFAAGLGKLVLNGLSTEASGIPGLYTALGYLEPELKLYAYQLVNKQYGVSVSDSTTHLAEDVVSMLSQFSPPKE